MGAIWQVIVKNTSGARVAILTAGQGGYAEFALQKRVNAPGAYALRLFKPDGETMAAFRTRMAATFGLDYQLEFYRSWPEMGIGWYLELEAFHRGGHFRYTPEGALIYESVGVGYLDLLRRRIVLAAPGSSEADKSGAAETVVKGYVDEQVGPSATGRVTSGLTVQADAGQGSTVSRRACYDSVLAACQELAAIGGGDIDVVGTGAATFDFRWYQGQRGTDRTATVTFAWELGNMAEPQLSLVRDEEVNCAIVAGQGEGAGRTIVSNTDNALEDDSPWNLREAFRDARHIPDYGELTTESYLFLDKHAPRAQLTFKPVQIPGCLLGKHYYFGDLVAVQFMDYEDSAQVAGYSITLNEQGETIDIELEGA